MKLAQVRAAFMLGSLPIAVLAACSLTTSLDGLSSGGADDAATSDKADVAAGDGMSADASRRDAAEETGSSSGDSAPPLPYCASLGFLPTLCDDFERTDLEGPWENVGLSGGGTVALAASTRTAAGKELLASIPVFAAGGTSVAKLDRSLGDARQQVMLSYAMRIEAAPAQGQQQVMLISVNPSDAPADFFHTYLFVASTGVTLVEETFPSGMGAMGTFSQKPLSEPIVFGVWQRVAMTVKLSAPPRVTVTIDGKLAFDDVADPFYRPGQAGVAAGIHYSTAPNGPLAVHVDDLFADAK